MGFMDMFKQNYESINVNDIYDVKVQILLM